MARNLSRKVTQRPLGFARFGGLLATTAKRTKADQKAKGEPPV